MAMFAVLIGDEVAVATRASRPTNALIS